MLIYLATPYSHYNPAVRELRFEECLRIACALINQGHPIIAPIAFYHEMHKRGDLPADIDFWEKMDKEILRGCTALWVAMMQGWLMSKGIGREIRWAQEFGLPIRGVDPLTLKVSVILI